jgi:RHS repeat-associated protein
VAARLGSIGKFYPYGVERPSATGNDKEKFTGYYRDASTGLDYADQRYHQPGVGRFMTPDRMQGNSADPGAWNNTAEPQLRHGVRHQQPLSGWWVRRLSRGPPALYDCGRYR